MATKPRRTRTTKISPKKGAAKPKAINLRIRNLAPDLLEHYTAHAARNGRTLEEELKAALSRGFSQQELDEAAARLKSKS